MTHIFDTNIAVEYGVEIAIVVNHLAFWIRKMKANGKHMHNGKSMDIQFHQSIF